MSVDVQLVLTPNRLKQFRGLSEAAIQEAITRAMVRIEQVGLEATPVGDPTNYGYSVGGRSPGALKQSFQIGHTPRSIVFGWSSLWLGVDYAEIADKGRTGRNPYPGWNFALHTKNRAEDILLDELRKAFQAIGSSTP